VEDVMLGSMMTAGSAITVAASNVAGGEAARRSSPVSTLLVVSPVTATVAVLAAVTVGGPVLTTAVGWGLLSGLAGSVGLLAAYRSLQIGRVGVVVAVTSCAATVTQVLGGWVLQGAPSPVILSGVALCVCAVALSSRGTASSGGGDPGAGVGPAALAGVCFASSVLLISRVESGQLWGLAAGRLTLLVIVIILARFLGTGLPRRRGTLALAGGAAILDISSNVLLLAALRYLDLSSIAAIQATVPLLAAAFAWIFLRERLVRVQIVGLGLAVVGVSVVLSG
jgi:drug/metabolite transporter (DMT)-like permease